MTEFSHLAFEDNDRQFGFYMVGIESPELVYGYDSKNALQALESLKEKGYSGQAWPFEAFRPKKNYCPSVWKTHD